MDLVLVRASDLAAEIPQTPWLIEPYIPTEGIVLLYGKKGAGKSPLTWALAEAVASGQPWLGLPVSTPGIVLYIEADTPRLVIQPRMSTAMHASGISVYFPPGAISDQQGWARLTQETRLLTPQLIIVNTLRKAHIGKDVDSNVPAVVYGRFRNQWPQACLLFVHHEKKTPANPDHVFSEGEEFSGSLAWANDAQVVLRLWHHRGRPAKEGQETILTMTGNQLAPLRDPLRFLLKDGMVVGFSDKQKHVGPCVGHICAASRQSNETT